MTTTVTRRGPHEARVRPGLVLALVCTAIFMLMLDAMVVSAALADIRADFGSSLDGLQWVIDAYSIPLAGLLLTFATAGDRFGRRRMFLAGMAVFTAASLGLTLTETILQLDILRAVQSVGAALLFATALPLLAVAYPEVGARARAIGIYSAVMAAASVAGPVVGGLLVTHFGWRSIFLINVPIGIVVLAVAAVRLPESARAGDPRTDWLGSALLTAGLVAGVFGLTRGNALGWSSPAVLALGAAALVLLTAFMIRQFRTDHPLFDVTMMRKPGFAGVAIVSVAHMATLMAAVNYLAVFLIGTMDYSALQMGVRLLPISLAALVTAATAPALLKRVPIAVSIPTTMGLVALGMVLLGRVEAGDSWTHFVPAMLIGGVGLGAITAISQAAALTFAPAEKAGMASATFGTLRQIGLALGVAGLGAIFADAAGAEAERGLATLPVVVPGPMRAEFVDGVGAGAGGEVASAVPPQFAALTDTLADIARDGAVAGLNAVSTSGALLGLAAALVAAVAFRLGGRRAD